MKNKTDKELSYLPFLLTPEVSKMVLFSVNFLYSFSVISLQGGRHTLMSQGFSVVCLCWF